MIHCSPNVGCKVTGFLSVSIKPACYFYALHVCTLHAGCTFAYSFCSHTFHTFFSWVICMHHHWIGCWCFKRNAVTSPGGVFILPFFKSDNKYWIFFIFFQHLLFGSPSDTHAANEPKHFFPKQFIFAEKGHQFRTNFVTTYFPFTGTCYISSTTDCKSLLASSVICCHSLLPLACFLRWLIFITFNLQFTLSSHIILNLPVGLWVFIL